MRLTPIGILSNFISWGTGIPSRQVPAHLIFTLIIIVLFPVLIFLTSCSMTVEKVDFRTWGAPDEKIATISEEAADGSERESTVTQKGGKQ